MIPLMIWGYTISILLTVFIPIMGRTTTLGNPDISIGLITTLSTIVILAYFFPLLINSKFNLNFALIYIAIFISTFSTLFLSNAGFPFHYDTNFPTTKRLNIFAAKRTFVETNGTIIKSDSLYKIDRQDYTGNKVLSNAIPEYKTKLVYPNKENCSKSVIKCGNSFKNL